jgi:hypothetical protein
MPWVFTFNDWSAGTEYDHMVKAAVTSAIEVARMKPFCMYSGSTTSEMYQWFLSKGVTIIQVCGMTRCTLSMPHAAHHKVLLRHIVHAAHPCLEGCIGPGRSAQPRV